MGMHTNTRESQDVWMQKERRVYEKARSMEKLRMSMFAGLSDQIMRKTSLSFLCYQVCIPKDRFTWRYLVCWSVQMLQLQRRVCLSVSKALKGKCQSVVSLTTTTPSCIGAQRHMFNSPQSSTFRSHRVIVDRGGIMVDGTKKISTGFLRNSKLASTFCNLHKIIPIFAQWWIYDNQPCPPIFCWCGILICARGRVLCCPSLSIGPNPPSGFKKLHSWSHHQQITQFKKQQQHQQEVRTNPPTHHNNINLLRSHRLDLRPIHFPCCCCLMRNNPLWSTTALPTTTQPHTHTDNTPSFFHRSHSQPFSIQQTKKYFFCLYEIQQKPKTKHQTTQNINQTTNQ